MEHWKEINKQYKNMQVIVLLAETEQDLQELI